MMLLAVCLVLFTFALAQSDSVESYNNFFGGKYNGTCEIDGYYYLDELNYITCEFGHMSVQPCAPGSRSLPYNNYPGPGMYRDIILCNVNLVDTGYTAQQQVAAAAPGQVPPSKLPSQPPFTFIINATTAAPVVGSMQGSDVVSNPGTSSNEAVSPGSSANVPSLGGSQVPSTGSPVAQTPGPSQAPSPGSSEAQTSGPSQAPSPGSSNNPTPSTNIQSKALPSRAKAVSYTFYFLHSLKGDKLKTEKVWGFQK